MVFIRLKSCDLHRGALCHGTYLIAMFSYVLIYTVATYANFLENINLHKNGPLAMPWPGAHAGVTLCPLVFMQRLCHIHCQ